MKNLVSAQFCIACLPLNGQTSFPGNRRGGAREEEKTWLRRPLGSSTPEQAPLIQPSTSNPQARLLDCKQLVKSQHSSKRSSSVWRKVCFRDGFESRNSNLTYGLPTKHFIMKENSISNIILFGAVPVFWGFFCFVFSYLANKLQITLC